MAQNPLTLPLESPFAPRTSAGAAWRIEHAGHEPRALDLDQHWINSFGRLARQAAFLAITIGCLGLVGWRFDLAVLKSVVKGSATMKPITGLAILVAGVSLALRTGKHRSAGRLAPALALGVAAIGLLNVSEHWFGWDSGTDRWLLAVLSGSDGSSTPGRMPLPTAITFVLFSMALLLLDARRGPRLAQFLAVAAALVPLMVLVDYVYGVRPSENMAAEGRMALHTAVALAALGFGLLFARPDRGFIALVSNDRVGGTTVRRLLPVVAVVSVALGWLRLLGQRSGLYGGEFGVSLSVVVSVVILAVVVWRNARALDQLDAERKSTEQALREREQLAAFSVDMSVALTQSHSVSDMLRRSAEVLMERFEAARTGIWLLDESGEILELAASAGSGTDAREAPTRVPVGKFKIGVVAQNRQPLITYEVANGPPAQELGPAARTDWTAFAGYPLIVEDRLVGVLAMFGETPFSKAAIQAMTSVSNGLALGVDRKRKEDALREQATHDPLTGVWNRAAILHALDTELARADRTQQPLSLVMADLDHFKRINDSFGHVVGDTALRELARRMLESKRPYDLIGRYGGEEFLIVLPGCDLGDAMNVAERIRRAVSGHALDTLDGLIALTASMGVATSKQPSDRGAAALIDAADSALFRAKRRGRNRVELSPAVVREPLLSGSSPA